MNSRRKKHAFPIEEKLAALEWNLELLKASAEVTHTPLRTLKSMAQANVVVPTQRLLRELIDSSLFKTE